VVAVVLGMRLAVVRADVPRSTQAYRTAHSATRATSAALFAHRIGVVGLPESVTSVNSPPTIVHRGADGTRGGGRGGYPAAMARALPSAGTCVVRFVGRGRGRRIRTGPSPFPFDKFIKRFDHRRCGISDMLL
jgi:hypothetical protein